MTDLVIAILAAGASRRMRGGDKLLEPVDGAPLLRVLARRAARIGPPVIVTLPPAAPARRAALEGTGARPVIVADAASGMAASFRALAALVPPAAGAMIVLGDMPEITTRDLARLVAAWRDAGCERIARAATADGRAGQPLIFPARLVAGFARLQGDRGARDVVAGEDVVTVPLAGTRALVDLDTPEAWAEWRARSAEPPSR